MKNYAWRVYKGMQWLDKDRPGWEKKINLRTLNLKDQRTCVLGQLYGQARWRIPLAPYGFDAYADLVDGVRPTHDEMSMELWYLTTEWKRQIKLRLEQS